MTTKLYVPSHALFSGSAEIGGIQNISWDRQIQEIVQGSDGQVHNSFITTGSESPVVGITTTDVKAALDAVGLNGRVIGSGDTMTTWLAQMDEATGVRKTGSNHVALLINEGRLLPRVLTAENNQPATQLLDAIATYDGTNKPLVVTDSQAITGSASAITGILFTLGPVKFNGVAQGGVQRMTFDPGIQEIVQGSDGDGYPTFVGILRQNPRFTITFEDASIFATIDGMKAEPTITVYLRKMAQNSTGGIRVADATAEHIKFTIPLATAVTRAPSAAHGSQASFDVDIIPYSDAAAAIFTISTTSAIT